MNELEDGGPAFPRPMSQIDLGEYNKGCAGMSLRDWFAGLAMQGIVSSHTNQDRKKLVEELGGFKNITPADLVTSDAYILADAMLKARNAKDK